MGDLEQFKFSINSEYKIGAVTYEVTAHFSEESNTLDNKIKNLLLENIRKNENSTFVNSQIA